VEAVTENLRTGILLRVAVDSQSANWNAPCTEDGRFCYVPIPDSDHSPRSRNLDHYYDEFIPFVRAMGGVWPPQLGGTCHLDPDFAHLTYGDAKNRAQRIRDFLSPGDFIAFWAGMRLIDGKDKGTIVCSLIGFFKIAQIVNASDIGPLDWHRNAHSRKNDTRCESVVVFAEPRESGRLRNHIPIGRFRNGAQRVDRNLLRTWGDLCTKNCDPWPDGYIQISGAPPLFRKPERFLEWFGEQGPQLVHANNV
jgi:hypothetical protein